MSAFEDREVEALSEGNFLLVNGKKFDNFSINKTETQYSLLS